MSPFLMLLLFWLTPTLLLVLVLLRALVGALARQLGERLAVRRPRAAAGSVS